MDAMCTATEMDDFLTLLDESRQLARLGKCTLHVELKDIFFSAEAAYARGFCSTPNVSHSMRSEDRFRWQRTRMLVLAAWADRLA